MRGLKDLEIILTILENPEKLSKWKDEMYEVIQEHRDTLNELAEEKAANTEKESWLNKWESALKEDAEYQAAEAASQAEEWKKIAAAKEELAVKEALVNDKAADAADTWEGAVALSEQNAQIAEMLDKDEKDLKAREKKLAEKEAALAAAMAG